MEQFIKILTATDFSQRGLRAVRRAAMLGKDLALPQIELMTVKDAGLPDVLAKASNMTLQAAEETVVEHTQRDLQLIADDIRDNFGVASALTVRFGYVEREIIKRASESDADLTVIGAHGGNFITDLLLGNTTDRLIQLSQRPLLIAKNEPRQSYRTILVPVDFSDDSVRAAKLALRISCGAQLMFLHAFDVYDEKRLQHFGIASELIAGNRVKAEQDAREKLNAFIAATGADQYPLTRKLVFGLPGPAIRDEVKLLQPDLIVIGKHGNSRMEDMLLGSVTRSTIHQTSCDIVVASSPMPPMLP